MNEIQIFNNPQFGEIRTSKTDEGEPLFCLIDLCNSLNLSNARAVAQRLDQDEVRKLDLRGQVGVTNFVTEPGMYSVILRSDSPLAKPMQKWVTSEVLPSIRKNGGYIASKPDDTPEMIMARGFQIAMATIEKQKAKLELSESKIELLEEITKEQAPKVLFADAVATSDKSILIGELAKIICQNGYEIGQNRLFTWLRENWYLGTHGEYYNIPTQRAIEMGLFEIKKTSITKPDGTVLVSTTSKVTGKGQIYFVNKFLKSK